jgi:hypothetical protein
MRPTHYYIELVYSTQLKNSLQRDAYAYLSHLSGRLIVAKDLDIFRDAVINKFQRLNGEYKRCSSLNVFFWGSTEEGFRLSGFSEVQFRLKPAVLTELNSFDKF